MTSSERQAKIRSKSGDDRDFAERSAAVGTEKPVTVMRHLIHDRRGVTAVEYGLIAGLISVAIIAVLLTLGADLTNVFNDVSGGLQNSSSQ
jgi:pilus assembly protein Flp/PilA